jgi:hypothetical protein
MDEFEKRLKRDADAIQAEVSPELRARIDASLRGTEQLRPTSPAVQHSPVNLWWASSLTGLAAAVMVIVLINWDRTDAIPAPVEPVAGVTVPADPDPLARPPMLDIRTADFTRPLEDELVRLQSDLEKARESVKKDLDFTF